jgi:hypothetical protein
MSAIACVMLPSQGLVSGFGGIVLTVQIAHDYDE